MLSTTLKMSHDQGYSYTFNDIINWSQWNFRTTKVIEIADGHLQTLNLFTLNSCKKVGHMAKWQTLNVREIDPSFGSPFTCWYFFNLENYYGLCCVIMHIFCWDTLIEGTTQSVNFSSLAKCNKYLLRDNWHQGWVGELSKINVWYRTMQNKRLCFDRQDRQRDCRAVTN